MPLGISLPDSVREKIWNSIIDFLVKEAGKYASMGMASRVEGLRSDRAFEGDVRKAIESAASRFADEYPDTDLARALAIDTRFYDLPSVHEAIRFLISHPFSPTPLVTLEDDFASVLAMTEKPKANEAVQFFMERLREELIGVKKLHDTLDLMLQLEGVRTEKEMSDTLKRIESLLQPRIQPSIEAIPLRNAHNKAGTANHAKPLTPAKINGLLQIAGYKYHCFISWPPGNPDLLMHATQLKQDIETELKYWTTTPRLFLDESDFEDGGSLEQNLPRALCKSLVMVALCYAPYYDDPLAEHCRQAWAAMRALEIARLGGENVGAIIAVIVRQDKLIPEAVLKVKHYNCSRIMVRGRRIKKSSPYNQMINDIADHIKIVAEIIARKQFPAGCDHFQLPAESPFDDYLPSTEAYPFGLGGD